MKEQRSISVPGINLEDEDDEENKDKTQPRPGSLFEVFMALKEKERYTIKIYKYNQLSSGRPKPNKTEGSAELFGRIIRPNVHSVSAEYSAEQF